MEELENAYSKWSDYNKELLKQIFSDASISEEYSHWIGIGFIRERTYAEKVKEFRDDVALKIHRLESISERLELIPFEQTRWTPLFRQKMGKLKL